MPSFYKSWKYILILCGISGKYILGLGRQVGSLLAKSPVLKSSGKGKSMSRLDDER